MSASTGERSGALEGVPRKPRTLRPLLKGQTAFNLRHRQMAADVYELIREKILDGSLSPGMLISQAQLADELGTSRGPISDALSRLHERGLVVAEPNQRPRVADFDADALDSLYGARITLECFGVGLTAATCDPDTATKLQALLAEMTPVRDTSGWRALHRQLHATLVSGAGSITQDTVVSLAERAEVYYRLYGTQDTLVHNDHKDIVQAVTSGQVELAQSRHAHHLSRVCLMIMSNMAPDYEPVRIRTAFRRFRLKVPG